MRLTLTLALAALPCPSLAAGIECQLTYACLPEECSGGEITVKIEERDGQAGVVGADDSFLPVQKLADAMSGWVTYIAPADDDEIYFMSVTPDGTALASGHQLSSFDGSLTVYGATGTCKAME